MWCQRLEALALHTHLYDGGNADCTCYSHASVGTCSSNCSQTTAGAGPTTGTNRLKKQTKPEQLIELAAERKLFMHLILQFKEDAELGEGGSKLLHKNYW